MFLLLGFSCSGPQIGMLYLSLYMLSSLGKSICFLGFFFKEYHVCLFKKILLILIYLFLAVLGLRFCERAFSSCGKRGPFFIVVRGPLTIAASLVVEHRLQTRRLSSCGTRA